MKLKKIFLVSIATFTLLLSGCSISLDGLSALTGNLTSGLTTDTIVETVTSSDPSSNETVSQVYNNVITSVVTVLTYDSQYDGISSGSGVVIGEDSTYAYIYTNSHVVAYSTSTPYGTTTAVGSYFEVVFSNNYREEADLVTRDGGEDVAVLRVNISDNYTIAVFGNSSSLSNGQQILAIGSPLGYNYSNTLTTGVISNLDVVVDTDNDEDGNETTMYLIQIDSSLNPGNSGGPLFDMNGNLVGINTLKITTSDNGDSVDDFNYSIPINHFKLVADELINNGSYSRPLIGVSVVDIAEMTLDQRTSAGIDVAYGLYVNEVSPTGPSAGLISQGQVITKIDDVVVTRKNEFSVSLYENLPGDQVVLEVSNKDGSNIHNVTITLGSAS